MRCLGMLSLLRSGARGRPSTARIGLLLAALAGCADDLSTDVNVAPSAERKMDAVLKAVDRLNAQLGEEIYTVRTVSSEQRIDGEVVLRVVGDLGMPNAFERRVGHTDRTARGVIVNIIPSATPASIAHELGHAAGLVHVDDVTNLMYPVTIPTRWSLNAHQIEGLRLWGSSSLP